MFYTSPNDSHVKVESELVQALLNPIFRARGLSHNPRSNAEAV